MIAAVLTVIVLVVVEALIAQLAALRAHRVFGTEPFLM
jgi:hypothetical protein